MTCQEFWNEMSEGEGRPDAMDSAWSGHLKECPQCAGTMAGHRAIVSGLREMAADARRIEAPRRVERLLLTAFRAEAGMVPNRARRRWWIPALSWASAAAAMTALAVFLVSSHVPAGQNAPARPAEIKRNSVQLAVTRLPAVILGQSAAGTAGEFIPLPNAPEIGPNEQLDMVRLEVPRAELLALGYVVNADRGTETVEADVMLGSDGLARAVRFVE